MAEPLPFFKFYPANWLLSRKIRAMTTQQVAAYITLLCQQWMGKNCTLPESETEVKLLANWHESDGEFGPVLACFPLLKRPSHQRANPRLYHEYQEALASRQALSASGQKGAEVRWKKPVEKPLANGSATWDAYASAYQTRYKVLPVRNQQVNSQLKQLVARLGQDDAPKIAAFYLTHHKPLYVSARHPTNLLLRDCEGLRTEWATGMKATTGEAKQMEQQDDARAQIARVTANLERKGVKL
jgi:hypothetical protein